MIQLKTINVPDRKHDDDAPVVEEAGEEEDAPCSIHHHCEEAEEQAWVETNIPNDCSTVLPRTAVAKNIHAPPSCVPWEVSWISLVVAPDYYGDREAVRELAQDDREAADQKTKELHCYTDHGT